MILGLYYSLVAIWGVAQLFVPENAGIHFLANVAIALPPTIWMIGDAKNRGVSIPHIAQPAILVLWFLVIPVYLVYTRKLKGFGWAVFHFVGTILVMTLMYNVAILCYWGPSAYANEPEIDIRCQLLVLPEDYFDGYGLTLPQDGNDTLVLTDAETFFLFQSKQQVKPAWNRIRQMSRTLVHDDVAIHGDDYMVDISWQRNRDPASHDLEIAASANTEFRLSQTVRVTIPNAGSVILRTAESAEDGETIFLWIIVRDGDDSG